MTNSAHSVLALFDRRSACEIAQPFPYTTPDGTVITFQVLGKLAKPVEAVFKRHEKAFNKRVAEYLEKNKDAGAHAAFTTVGLDSETDKLIAEKCRAAVVGWDVDDVPFSVEILNGILEADPDFGPKALEFSEKTGNFTKRV